MEEQIGIGDPRNCCLVLTFLDLLLESKPPQISIRNKENTFSNLYHFAKERLGRCLNDLGYELIEEEEVLYLNKSSSRITEEEGISMRIDLEKKMNNKGFFDYPKLINEYFKKSQSVLQDIQEKTPLFDGEKLGRLKCAEILIEEGDVTTYNEENEWNFASTSAGIVYFPNANKFNQKHKDFWLAVSSEPNRFYRDYFYRSIFVPFHEILHCFQGHKWKWGMNLWKAEFEVSYPHLEFFYISCKKFKELDVFYETLLWLETLVKKIHNRIITEKKNLKVLDVYEDWRNGYGLKGDPFEKDSSDILPHMNSYFKLRLPLETFDLNLAGEKIMIFLNFHWKPNDLNEKSDWIQNKKVPEILLKFNNSL